MSGDSCRDKLYLIIKVLEEMRLSIIIKASISKRVVQELFIGFIGSTDFFTQGSNTTNKMKTILNIHNRLYKVIGKIIKIIKTTFYSWR